MKKFLDIVGVNFLILTYIRKYIEKLRTHMEPGNSVLLTLDFLFNNLFHLLIEVTQSIDLCYHTKSFVTSRLDYVLEM